MEDIIITALPEYPGKRVVKDLGFIFAFDDRLSPVLFMEEHIKEAQNLLKRKAFRMGANAILNITLCPDEHMKGFISGEAVILESIENNL